MTADETPPEPRTVTVVETWTPVGGPYRCAQCRHNHWLWMSGNRRNYGICEDETCSCSSLMSEAYARRYGIAPVASS